MDARSCWEQKTTNKIFTYNDSSNWIHPVIKIVCQENRNEPDDVCDDVKEVILGICFHDFIGESAAIENQEEFNHGNGEHDAYNPSLLIFG